MPKKCELWGTIGLVHRTLGSHCVCVKKEMYIFAWLVDVLQVYKSQLGKFLNLTCPNSECGKMKTHQAASSLGRRYCNFWCTYKVRSAAGLSKSPQIDTSIL